MQPVPQSGLVSNAVDTYGEARDDRDGISLQTLQNFIDCIPPVLCKATRSDHAEIFSLFVCQKTATNIEFIWKILYLFQVYRIIMLIKYIYLVHVNEIYS